MTNEELRQVKAETLIGLMREYYLLAKIGDNENSKARQVPLEKIQPDEYYTYICDDTIFRNYATDYVAIRYYKNNKCTSTFFIFDRAEEKKLCLEWADMLERDCNIIWQKRETWIKVFADLIKKYK
jgi:hypothetical protein